MACIIQSPDPTLYQPRGPKSSNTSIYLFTDLDSHAEVPQVTEPPCPVPTEQEDHGFQGRQAPGLEQQQKHLQAGLPQLWKSLWCQVGREKLCNRDEPKLPKPVSDWALHPLLLTVARLNLLLTPWLWSSWGRQDCRLCGPPFPPPFLISPSSFPSSKFSASMKEKAPSASLAPLARPPIGSYRVFVMKVLKICPKLLPPDLFPHCCCHCLTLPAKAGAAAASPGHGETPYPSLEAASDGWRIPSGNS